MAHSNVKEPKRAAIYGAAANETPSEVVTVASFGHVSHVGISYWRRFLTGSTPHGYKHQVSEHAFTPPQNIAVELHPPTLKRVTFLLSAFSYCCR